MNNNTDMNLSITEMMELILTGANGSELAVEGVMLNAIDHIKKLEEQNELMLNTLKGLRKSIGLTRYERARIEHAVADIEGRPTDTIAKLEKGNEMMLEALNKLINVANNAVPMNFMKELDEVVGHCKQVVNEIEGEQQ